VHFSFSARAHYAGSQLDFSKLQYSFSFSFASNKEVLKAEFSSAKSNPEKFVASGTGGIP